MNNMNAQNLGMKSMNPLSLIWSNLFGSLSKERKVLAAKRESDIDNEIRVSDASLNLWGAILEASLCSGYEGLVRDSNSMSFSGQKLSLILSSEKGTDVLRVYEGSLCIFDSVDGARPSEVKSPADIASQLKSLRLELMDSLNKYRISQL